MVEKRVCGTSGTQQQYQLICRKKKDGGRRQMGAMDREAVGKGRKALKVGKAEIKNQCHSTNTEIAKKEGM